VQTCEDFKYALIPGYISDIEIHDINILYSNEDVSSDKEFNLN